MAVLARIFTVFLSIVFCACLLVNAEPPAQCKTCLQSNTCKPPDCFCCREELKLPNLNRLTEIPQIVFFTFDDAVTDQVAGFYYQLFDSSRKNPNGCPISMTLFISHDNTKYRLVSDFHKKGMEIASHSVTHATMNGSNFFEEAKGQKENLAKLANIPVNEITGWRSPFLKPTGDLQPDALKKLGYDYDATLTFSKRSFREKPPGPFTLDFGYPYECQVKPCPKHKHPGFWEIPVVSLMDYMQKYDCVYVDGCMNAPPDEEAAYKFLWDNFQTYYTQTRMPFGINMHSSWFFYPDRLRAMDRFIKKLVSLNDVYVISANRMLEWLKDPMPLHNLNSFAPWACDGSEKKFRSGPRLVKTNLPPPPVPWVPRRLGSMMNARRMFNNPVPSAATDRQILRSNSRRPISSVGQNVLEVKPTVLFRTVDPLRPRVPNTQFETQQQRLRNNLIQRQSNTDRNNFESGRSSSSRRDQSSRRNMINQHEQLIRQQKRLEEARLQKEEAVRKQREREQLRRQQELLERQKAMVAEQQQSEQRRLLQQRQRQQQQLQQQQQQQQQHQQQQLLQQQQQQQLLQQQVPSVESQGNRRTNPVVNVQFFNDQSQPNNQMVRSKHRQLLEKQQALLRQQQQQQEERRRQRQQEDRPAVIDSPKSQTGNSQSDINTRHRDLIVLQQSLQDKQGSVNKQLNVNGKDSEQSVRPETMVRQKTVVWQPAGVESKPDTSKSSPRPSPQNRFLQKTVQLWPQSDVFGNRPVVSSSSSSDRINDPTSSRFNDRQSSSTRNGQNLLRRIERPARTGQVAAVTPAPTNNIRVPFRYTESPRHRWYSDFTARFGPMSNGPRFSRGGSNRRPGFGPVTPTPRSQSQVHRNTIIPRLKPDSVTLTSRRRVNRNQSFRRSGQNNGNQQQNRRNIRTRPRGDSQAMSFRERTVSDSQPPRIPFAPGVLHPSVSQQIAWNSFIRNMLGP